MKVDLTTGNSPYTLTGLTEGKFYSVTCFSTRSGVVSVRMKDANANLIPLVTFTDNSGINIPVLHGTELVFTLTRGATATMNVTLAT